jgi:hypothetical protein
LRFSVIETVCLSLTGGKGCHPSRQNAELAPLRQIRPVGEHELNLRLQQPQRDRAALLTPFAAFGGLWLAVTMVFATLAHIVFLHTNPAPAIVLIVLDLLVVWLCRDQLAVLRRYF